MYLNIKLKSRFASIKIKIWYYPTATLNCTGKFKVIESLNKNRRRSGTVVQCLSVGDRGFGPHQEQRYCLLASRLTIQSTAYSQKKHSVKTLTFPLFGRFFRHFLLKRLILSLPEQGKHRNRTLKASTIAFGVRCCAATLRRISIYLK